MAEGVRAVKTDKPLPTEELRLGYFLWRAEEAMDSGGRGVVFSVALPVTLQFRLAQDGHSADDKSIKRQFRGEYEGLLIALGRSRDQPGSGRRFWTAAVQFDDEMAYNFDYRIFKQSRRSCS